MEELLARWRQQEDEAETLASIQRGIDDANAVRMKSVDEVDVRIRRELGLPARDK